MKNEKEYDTILMSKAIFDDTHRTVMEKAPGLLLPVINEVFRTDYGMDISRARVALTVLWQCG